MTGGSTYFRLLIIVDSVGRSLSSYVLLPFHLIMSKSNSDLPIKQNGQIVHYIGHYLPFFVDSSIDRSSASV